MTLPRPSPYAQPVTPLMIDPEWLAPLPPARGMTVTDLMLRIGGGAVAVLAGVITAVTEVFLSPLRVEGQLVGASVLLAIAGNVGLALFAYWTVGTKWAIGLPAVAWFMVLLVSGSKTTEGDLLLSGDNWVGLATIFGGSMAFALVAYRLILPPMRA